MKRIRNRVTELLGVEIPIVQAPMGWIARAQLASAVSNAGGLGIIETSSGELDAVRDEIRKMRDLTDKPFGVNIAQLFVRDPGIVDFVVEQGVRSSPPRPAIRRKYTAQLKEAGLTVFHVVPSLRAALKAVDAGVDGLVVEGGEGGGFKNPRDVATMVLLPLVCSQVDVPIIAAGGICDGPSDGGRLRARRRGRADGHAHGVGGRVAGARELEAGDRRGAAETDTVFLNRFSRPGLRALRTQRSERARARASRSSCRRLRPRASTSTSAATWRRRSRSAARSRAASTRCGRSPRSSRDGARVPGRGRAARRARARVDSHSVRRARCRIRDMGLSEDVRRTDAPPDLLVVPAPDCALDVAVDAHAYGEDPARRARGRGSSAIRRRSSTSSSR